MRPLVLTLLLLGGCRQIAEFDPAPATDSAPRDGATPVDAAGDATPRVDAGRDGATPWEQRPADGGPTDGLGDADGLGHADGFYRVENSLLHLDARLANVGPCRLSTLVIAEDADDSEIEAPPYYAYLPDGENDPDSGYPPGLYIGSWLSSHTWGIFRFLLPTLPSGARIVSARLLIWGQDQTAGWEAATDALRIYLEADPAAPRVSDWSEAPLPSLGTPQPNPRPVIEVPVSWPASGGLTWMVGKYNPSPELAEVFTKLAEGYPAVDTWSSLQLWLHGVPTGHEAEVMTLDYGMPDYHTPLLQLIWCAP